MKIAIITPTTIGVGRSPYAQGGQVRAAAFKNFLESRNHRVDMVSFDETYASKIWFYYQCARAYLLDREPEPRLMKKVADKLESRIKRGKYDAVIGVESIYSYVLTRELGCLRIFSWESIGADETYFEQCAKKSVDIRRIRRIGEMELEICRKSDYVIFPWETTENYVRKRIWNGDNFVTVKNGCYPQNKTVSYFSPVAIVSLGNLKHHWSNKELLSYLTRISPYVIDVYGIYGPPRKYHLNYKGFAPSLDILKNYQFGLNTVSKDIYRRNHFSSRILGYLAYGLPVLSPDWMKFSYEVKGVLPYNEKNFVEILEEHSYPDKWEKISKEAYAQALELEWRKVLQPLARMIENR